MTITPERAQELLDGATPGPWDVRDCNPGFRVINPHGDAELGTWAVADCWWAQDALMCAAAPDLARTVIAQAAEIARLRKIEAEYGAIETAIIMADRAFDGDSDHAYCKDRLLASITRLRAKVEAAEKLADVLQAKSVMDPGNSNSTWLDAQARAALTAYQEAGK